MTTPSIAQLFDLSGKAAIVTGGAVGIGQAIVLRLAEAGAEVMIVDIDLEAAERTVENLRAMGNRAAAMQADVASTTAAQRAVGATLESFGRLDILVNNAGIYPSSPVLEVSEELWDKTHNVNLRGMFFFSQAGAQGMIRQGHGGKIINVASIVGMHPTPRMSHYAASKGGVIMLTKSLALELAPHNILVNAIAPGGIETPGTQPLVDDLRVNPKAQRFLKAHVPLGRMGKPDEIARVVLFLASGAADYITGTLIPVEGGALLT